MTTASPIFAFDLGNGLSQTYLASLTPGFRTEATSLPAYVGSGYIPPQDKLQFPVAEPSKALGTSDPGRVEFNANSEVGYIRLLQWRVAGWVTYTLSLSAVPEPAALALMSAGLGFLAWRRHRSTRPSSSRPSQQSGERGTKPAARAAPSAGSSATTIAHCSI